MKSKTVLIIGIVATIMILSAAFALAQNTGETTNNVKNQECTIEITDGAKDCSELMSDSSTSESSTSDNTEAEESEHCGGMGSDTGSMMGSKGADLRSMM